MLVYPGYLCVSFWCHFHFHLSLLNSFSMARNNRNNGGRRDGRPQRSQTRERLRDEVERRGGASAASSPAPQAADAGGGSAREGEASGFRARGDCIDPRFAMFQAFSESMMGSVRLREEMERRMREAMAGGVQGREFGD